MAEMHNNNNDVDEYYDVVDFEYESEADEGAASEDFEEDLESKKAKTDTSALEVRNGKDIQGIPWERLHFSRDMYRHTRLKHYKNYQNLSPSPYHLSKECLQVEKGNTFYDFQFNTRLVKSTIAHFQLRNLLWATSKHDVYLMQNYSVMHWSSLLRRGKEVLNVAKPIVPTLYLNQPGVAFCTKISTDENAITNTVDVYHNPRGLLRIMTANNDAHIRVIDTENFACINLFSFDWPVNNTSVSPDGKLLAVLGDSTECLISDANSGKVTGSLKGHLDYSFASAWHPDGRVLATGNQDTTCRLWDIRNLSKSLAVLKGNMGAIRALKFTSDGRFLAMAEPADFVHIFDTESGYVKCQEIDLFGEIAGICFSPDTEALFVGIADRTYGSLLELTRRHYNWYLESIF